MVAVPELWFLHSRICCRDLGAFAPNDKHRLKKKWSHLVFTTSMGAPVRLARLAWFQAKQIYQNMVSGAELDRCPTCHKCQVNSRKSQIFPNAKPTWFLLAKLMATYNLAISLFCTTQSPFRTNLDDGNWLVAVPKLYIMLRQLPLL